MRYHLPAGNYIDVESATPLAITEALRQEAMGWVPSDSLEDYMAGVQFRQRQQDGRHVRIDSVENFVADLLVVDFLKPEAR